MLPVTKVVSMTNLSCSPPHAEVRLPLMMLYSTVLVVGLPANLLTVFLTWLQVRKKNVLGVYLWGLSLCDLTYLFTLPLWADYVGRGHSWRWTSAACKLTGFIFFTNMYVSIFLLCCISFDRYLAVVYSLEARGLRRQRHAALVVVIITLVVAVGHTPVFTMKEGATEGGSHRCFEPTQSSATVTAFSYARFIIGFLLPLLLLVATNRSVLANVQRSTGLHSGQKRRVRRLAVAVVLLFLVCFGPYHVVLLVRAVLYHLPQPEGRTCLLEQTMYTTYTISLGLSTINSAVNPILYVLSSNNIRKELRRGMAEFCGQNRLGHPPSSSSQNQIQPSNKTMELNVLTETERHSPGTPPGT
ncbi:probable G-protein coupled receptor 132b [Cololabis saira]|uniref:probable G-protein coupled receptor 132b n=1 Tax=Cololabis saira TaxID=129043 RepID=UPI002AD25955|nr:probable G-protein coupled receptor 132b [Cololabis saira]XP_061602883.1 probable G-protein coupled receptor 132b [Cololabis saira]